MHRTIGRALLGGADQVVFISPVVRDYFADFVRFRREPELIWNGVDTGMYTPGDLVTARAALGLSADKPVLLFVGRFVEKKGLRILKELATKLPDSMFVLAGWGPIDPNQWQGRNVRVVSGLRGADLVPLYRAADLLVLPSVGEGLPLVVQEAMSCGTPVLVGTDTAIAISAPPGLVYACPVEGAQTAEAWAVKLRSILSDRSGNDALREKIARFARERWTWDAASARYRQLFVELSSHR